MLPETMASRRLGSDGPTLDVVWMAEALCERNRWAVEEGSDLWWKLTDLRSEPIKLLANGLIG